MESARRKAGSTRDAVETEQILEKYYGRLLLWAGALTRGDSGMTREIVHDLCLHFVLARPDLSQVLNLDGYLYRCLKNIYLSSLARASRESAQVIATAEFDSLHLALQAADTEDLLQRQNDLRRICNYTVWRKESSKSASYLILLFFHGYSRREVAQIACLPIAAIYNKLKTARTELKGYFEQSGKLRVITGNQPPEPAVSVSPVSTTELFDELRSTIWAAKYTPCLPREELSALYSGNRPKPVECPLLAHIVSCSDCLALLNLHFQWPRLDDREPPAGLDSTGKENSSSPHGQLPSYREMMSLIRKETRGIYEHRPQTLSIAVNGRIVASHDVESEQSKLSARIERPEGAQFVEIFTEQNVRLALLPVEELPPDGPALRKQEVTLSDDRWIALTLNFDGLGLQSEVTYCDPALAAVDLHGDEDLAALSPAAIAATAPVGPSSHEGFRGTSLREFFGKLIPKQGFAWACVLVVLLSLAAAGVYRSLHPPLAAPQLLRESAQVEAAALKNHAAHQVLRIEETTSDGHVLEQATVDVWIDGDSGKSMRKLYNTEHQLIAAIWRDEHGRGGFYSGADEEKLSDSDRALAVSERWRTSPSAESFRTLAEQEQMRARRLEDTYEVTAEANAPGPSGIIGAALVLDRAYRPIAEILRIRVGSTTQEVRLVQTSYELRPSASVPAEVYRPDDFERSPSTGMLDGTNGRRAGSPVYDSRLAQLEINVLYALHQLNADTGLPIEITRTRDGRIRVIATTLNADLMQQVRTRIEALPNYQHVEIRLNAQGGMPGLATGNTSTNSTEVYNFSQSSPADPLLRSYFARKGLTGEKASAAATQLSGSLMEGARRSLQHAYALERLGEAFTPLELRSADRDSQLKWTRMASDHAAALKHELQDLKDQLEVVVPVELPTSNAAEIDSPAGFSQAASRLLRQVQAMNRSIGNAFTSSDSANRPQSPDALVRAAEQSVPLKDASEMAVFTSHLAGTTQSADQSGAITNSR